MRLEVINLAKRYRNDAGLLTASFEVEDGESIAIVGPNGAGKSTLLKLLANWLVPDAGDIYLDGSCVADRRLVATRIGFSPETPNLFDAFSVEYNLLLCARLSHLPRARIEAVLRDCHLTDFRRIRIADLSTGLKQRVSIARALLADPPLILLDEPTSGLDPETAADFHHLFRKLRRAGRAILFSSHRAEEVRSVATRLLALEHGAIVFDGPPDEYFAGAAVRRLAS